MTGAERLAIGQAVLDCFGEDASSIGRILAYLERRAPAVAWRTQLATLITTWPAYTAAGLSVDWFVTEVNRYADIYKAA